MTYQPLTISPQLPKNVKALIRHIDTYSFSDVHSMLRLPINNYNISAGCNFAIAHVLMAVIGGISTTLYKHQGNVGERFKGVLIEYYPWELEPDSSVSPQDAAEAIYNIFRNPITHDLGIDIKNNSSGLIVKYMRINSETEKGIKKGLDEKQIEDLELSQLRPILPPTVKIASHKYVLLIEGLYWGLRRTIERLLEDEIRITKAENFLQQIIGSRNKA